MFTTKATARRSVRRRRLFCCVTSVPEQSMTETAALSRTEQDDKPDHVNQQACEFPPPLTWSRKIPYRPHHWLTQRGSSFEQSLPKSHAAVFGTTMNCFHKKQHAGACRSRRSYLPPEAFDSHRQVCASRGRRRTCHREHPPRAPILPSHPSHRRP